MKGAKTVSNRNVSLPKYLSWWALPAYAVPAIVFVGLLSYAMWMEWSLS